MRLALIAAIGLTCSACASVPAPRNVTSLNLAKDEVDSDLGRDLILRIACELNTLKPEILSQFVRQATQKKEEKVAPAAGMLEPAYDITVELTLKAEATGGLAPAVGFTDTFGGNDDTRSAIFGFSVSRGRVQSIVETFAIDPLLLGNGAIMTRDGRGCTEVNDKIRGGFGLNPLISRHFSRNLPALVRNVGTADDSFSSTIDFTVEKSLNLGPHWVTKHFEGPSGDGLVSGKRTDTNTLAITIAWHDTETPAGDTSAARARNNERILRNLQLQSR